MTAERMGLDDDLSTSSNCLRKAVPLMVQRRIPPTPHNYALWYAHVRNEHPELSEALLKQFPASGSYDPDLSESLFFEFFVKTYLPNSPKAQNLLAGILGQLAGSVSKSIKGTEEYGAALKDSLDIFTEPTDPDRIRDAITRLMEDTATLEALNKELTDELKSASAELAKLKKELEQSQHSALVDGLTKIANRRAFDREMIRALSSAEEPTSLLLIDLDRFKECNDRYGHPMGDRILEIVGAVLAELRSDAIFVARYGGEEFAIVTSHALEEATALAERVRLKVAELRITRKSTNDRLGAITVSIGVAQAHAGDTPETLLERADSALYKAKHQGRNRVVVL